MTRTRFRIAGASAAALLALGSGCGPGYSSYSASATTSQQQQTYVQPQQYGDVYTEGPYVEPLIIEQGYEPPTGTLVYHAGSFIQEWTEMFWVSGGAEQPIAAPPG